MKVAAINGNLPIKPKAMVVGKSFGEVMQQKENSAPFKSAFESFRQEISTNHQDFKHLVQKVVSQKARYNSHDLLRFQLLTGNYAFKQQAYFKCLELGSNGVKSLFNMPV